MYIMQYVTRIKKHSHNQIRKAIIEIESNRKEYESLHPYCERWSFSKGKGCGGGGGGGNSDLKLRE